MLWWHMYTLYYFKIKSTNMLMIWWWLQDPSAHWMYYHTWLLVQLLTCIQVTAAINIQPSCRFEYSNRTVGLAYVHRRLSTTMSTCTIWVCAMSSTDAAQLALAKAAKFWCTCYASVGSAPEAYGSCRRVCVCLCVCLPFACISLQRLKTKR